MRASEVRKLVIEVYERGYAKGQNDYLNQDIQDD
jgi:hypothetical protein